MWIELWLKLDFIRSFPVFFEGDNQIVKAIFASFKSGGSEDGLTGLFQTLKCNLLFFSFWHPDFVGSNLIKLHIFFINTPPIQKVVDHINFYQYDKLLRHHSTFLRDISNYYCSHKIALALYAKQMKVRKKIIEKCFSLSTPLQTTYLFDRALILTCQQIRSGNFFNFIFYTTPYIRGIIATFHKIFDI